MVDGWKRRAVERLAPVSSGKAEAQEVDRPGLRIGKDLNGQRHAPQCRRRRPCRQLADEQAGERCSEQVAICAASAERTAGRAYSAGPP